MKHVKYLQWNTDGSDMIVCIHGYADKAQMFGPLRSIFPNKCVVSVNLPMSHKEHRIYDVNELSEYVLTVLNETHATNYSLIGFSLGGLVATEIASKDKNVKKLMLLNSFPFFLIDAMPFRDLLYRMTSILKSKPLLKFYSRIHTNKIIKRLLRGADLPDHKKVYMKDKYYNVFGTLLNCLFYSGLDKYQQLNIPKKIVLFEDDHTLPYKRFSKDANRHDLKVTTIKSGGHNKTKDYWKNVEATLKDFFE
jgi:pimeloyl-ACP methyl ester carboxylesterase